MNAPLVTCNWPQLVYEILKAVDCDESDIQTFYFL